MSLIPTSSFVTQATGAVVAQFNYVARPIKIHKEPLQTIVSQPANPLFGYEPDAQSISSEMTYTEISATYSGLIIYPLKTRNQNSKYFDNNIIINPNSTYIKLKEDGKNFILNGQKNLKLEFDSQTWNFTEGNKFQVQNYLGLQFYYFEVNGTN
jgi:hypothetical protein